ncbi:UDP-glucose dehydrogenase family protein [Aureimonas jatrophae]|uniref:UDP-glucose 6-dehydrogenase n=1 Tax=Aureimonas jatrophae TaxID=1166073 RepID=A0A1H0NL60_9HYPH|nr:UDP-glucose/GDP-mannose dehydrogenase family protein [Aureimonas jatrophae]MBB3951164.1 UDPglucose 6-dehydrogenase [Aureimonas jatrophae]SDO93336.1 UDP-glucose dehydrogenase [Aureimonas jatrophae]
MSNVSKIAPELPRVAVVGTGYVGLVSGACLADVGCHVTCIDKATAKIEALRRGEIPIYEPGLDEVVLRNVEAGRLRFTTEIAEGVADADVVLIAVGTPTRKLDGNADLQYVYAASEEIARALDHYAVVVTKSTVPAGTGFEIRRIIEGANPTLDFDVASNPEFLREGNAIGDFMKPDRIVIGTDSERARQTLEALYSPFTSQGFELISTDIISSELIKYAANTFLATKVSFINEMADLCEKVGGNISDISRGMGSDRRIGRAFLQPGPGYGGSCFPKDTLAMVHIGEKALSPATIVEAVISVNRMRPHRMVAKVVEAAGGDVRNKTIALLGLTFKPDTDDVRDSVAILVAEHLSQQGAHVRAFDPQGAAHAKSILGDAIRYSGSVDEALRGADLCVIATEWRQFADKPIEEYKRLLADPVIVDFRNIFSPDAMRDAGISYYSIGRTKVVVPAVRLASAS